MLQLNSYLDGIIQMDLLKTGREIFFLWTHYALALHLAMKEPINGLKMHLYCGCTVPGRQEQYLCLLSARPAWRNVSNRTRTGRRWWQFQETTFQDSVFRLNTGEIQGQWSHLWLSLAYVTLSELWLDLQGYTWWFNLCNLISTPWNDTTKDDCSVLSLQEYNQSRQLLFLLWTCSVFLTTSLFCQQPLDAVQMYCAWLVNGTAV